jgi:hypothetical protein
MEAGRAQQHWPQILNTRQSSLCLTTRKAHITVGLLSSLRSGDGIACTCIHNSLATLHSCRTHSRSCTMHWRELAPAS